MAARRKGGTGGGRKSASKPRKKAASRKKASGKRAAKAGAKKASKTTRKAGAKKASKTTRKAGAKKATRPLRKSSRKGAKKASEARREPSGRKPAASAAPRRRRVIEAFPVPVGRVMHYFGEAGAAQVDLVAELRQGDTLHFRGQTTDFLQRVERLEQEGRPVEGAGAGESVGLAVDQRVRAGDRVYRLSY